MKPSSKHTAAAERAQQAADALRAASIVVSDMEKAAATLTSALPVLFALLRVQPSCSSPAQKNNFVKNGAEMEYRGDKERPENFPAGPILRRIEELEDPFVQEERALHVVGGRILTANYKLIRHDFPEFETSRLALRHPRLTSLEPNARAEAEKQLIDTWLIANAAIISCSQASQAVVNTVIRTEGQPFIAYRPAGYGRSLVVSVACQELCSISTPLGLEHNRSQGLLDLKGAGIAQGRTPSSAEHADGLEYLGDALADWTMQKIIDEVFQRTSPYFWTVPVYGILDLGFDIVHGHHPAGIHIRRAHRRPLCGMDLPSSGSPGEVVRCEIEMLLRNYGITSAGIATSYDIYYGRGAPEVSYNREQVGELSAAETHVTEQLKLGRSDKISIDGVNVQLAREVSTNPSSGQIVDFGQFNIRPRFESAVASLVRDRPLRLGSVLFPDHPAFVQPDPELALSLKTWERKTLNVLCLDLATQYREGALSRKEVESRIESIINEATEGWPA